MAIAEETSLVSWRAVIGGMHAVWEKETGADDGYNLEGFILMYLGTMVGYNNASRLQHPNAEARAYYFMRQCTGVFPLSSRSMSIILMCIIALRLMFVYCMGVFVQFIVHRLTSNNTLQILMISPSMWYVIFVFFNLSAYFKLRSTRSMSCITVYYFAYERCEFVSLWVVPRAARCPG